MIQSEQYVVTEGAMYTQYRIVMSQDELIMCMFCVAV
jgi:hypothetical protein